MRHKMKTMSISLSEELYGRIKCMIPAKKISQFVVLAITMELEKKEESLKQSYIAAENDEEHQAELAEWDAFDDWDDADDEEWPDEWK